MQYAGLLTKCCLGFFLPKALLCATQSLVFHKIIKAVMKTCRIVLLASFLGDCELNTFFYRAKFCFQRHQYKPRVAPWMPMDLQCCNWKDNLSSCVSTDFFKDSGRFVDHFSGQIMHYVAVKIHTVISLHERNWIFPYLTREHKKDSTMHYAWLVSIHDMEWRIRASFCHSYLRWLVPYSIRNAIQIH